MLNRINSFAIIGSLGLVFAGLVACSGDDKTTESREDDPSSELPAKIESTVVIDSNGNRTVTYDTIPQHLDSVRTINEKGDTVYRYDTTYVPADSTLYWVGNSSLVITEVSPVNLDWLDENGEDPGWIEIYNAGDVAANLKGYSLVKDTLKPRKWVFGDELIAAHEFRVVFCDKGNVVSVEGTGEGDLHKRLHTNWKLDKEGGSVFLIDPYYGIRDKVDYPELSSGMSWGIMDAGVWKYFEKPTPEQPNTKSTGYDGVVPKFDFKGKGGGFYYESVKLNPPTVSDGLKVRCTQDGSVPTENSPEFNSTITISENTVLRCAAYKKGMLTKDVVTNTYFIDEMVNMPVVAVSVDPSFFEKHYVKKSECSGSDPKTCPAGLMEDVEFPVHVEYFADGSKSKEKAFEIEAGISLMGGWSRVNDKKSVAIAMHEEYQAGRINYPLFETRKGVNDKYKAFNLRNNGNRFVSDYIEDAMAGALLEGSGVDYQRSRQVVVFYNGKYYGIHDMRERYNRAYVETNYPDISSSVVKLVKHLGSDTAITSSGDDPQAVADYLAMLKFIGNNDMSKAENYEAAKDYIDIGNYADYMIAEIYYHNGDWPNNNVRAWSAPGHPWKFMVYDVDHGFDWLWGVNGGEFDLSKDMFKWIRKGGGNKPCNEVGCFANLYIKLMENDDFKRLFLNHTAVMWQNYLNSKNVGKVIDKMVASIDNGEMERDLEKFKRSYDREFDKDGSHLKKWAEERDEKVLEEYRGEFDGLGDMVTVKIASSGKGVVLMEGMKLPGSTADATNYSGKFFNGLQMELTAVPAAGAVFKGWSDDASITEKTRLVTITEGLSITAKFE